MTLAAAPAEGVTLADVTFTFHDGDGLVQVMDETGVTLQEIDNTIDEFKGLYLLVDYPVELTAKLGRVRIRWAAVPAVVDAGYAEFDVDAAATYLRDLWLTGFGGKAEFDPATSSMLIYDENNDPYKRLPLQNKDGGDVVISGQGPVTRGAAIDP
jgi:hypothetical protein